LGGASRRSNLVHITNIFREEANWELCWLKSNCSCSQHHVQKWFLPLICCIEFTYKLLALQVPRAPKFKRKMAPTLSAITRQQIEIESS